jgi:hypothetical protein
MRWRKHSSDALSARNMAARGSHPPAVIPDLEIVLDVEVKEDRHRRSA